MTQAADPRIATGILIGMACMGMLVIFVVLPLLGRFSIFIEAMTLMIEAVGSNYGNTRVIWLGCGVVVLTVLGCCLVTVIIAGALLTCSTNNPAAICRLIGR